MGQEQHYPLPEEVGHASYYIIISCDLLHSKVSLSSRSKVTLSLIAGQQGRPRMDVCDVCSLGCEEHNLVTIVSKGSKIDYTIPSFSSFNCSSERDKISVLLMWMTILYMMATSENVLN